MQAKVTFRHMDSSEKLKTAANEALKRFEKFYDDIIDADAIFTDDGDKIVELTLKVKGDTLVVKEASDDFIKSLNEASDKMVRQIRKWKDKIRN